MAITISGGSGGTASISGDTSGIIIAGTDGAITVPSGTTAERPASPTAGMVRFNTDNNELEQYNGTDWGSVGGAVTPAAVSDQANTSTGYFDLPAGNTDQRPASPAAGMVRFNTTTGEPEWYDSAGAEWRGFSQAPTYDIQYLMVAGGGAGGKSYGGGGGAGGMLSDTLSNVTPGTSYVLVVGAGGAATSGTGNDGSDSTGFALTAVGGGGGGGGANVAGRAGGSGGGGAGKTGGGTGAAGGAGTSGQGNAGGTGISAAVTDGGGGGGGKGAAGSNAANANPTGFGGIGEQWLDTNYYAGGGGGSTNASGGTGGGGTGSASGTATAGTANTGGGGGATNTGTAAAGGSGIIILRYPGAQRGTGGTVTNDGTYTYHTFTSSGTYNA